MKPDPTNDIDSIRAMKSSSGYGAIVPCGLRRPNPRRWLKSKPQLPPTTPSSGIWGKKPD